MGYGGCSVAVEEAWKQLHSAQHKVAGGDKQDGCRGWLVQLGGGMVHGAPGGQLEILNTGLDVVRSACVAGPGWRPSVFLTKPALKEQLRACICIYMGQHGQLYKPEDSSYETGALACSTVASCTHDSRMMIPRYNSDSHSKHPNIVKEQPFRSLNTWFCRMLLTSQDEPTCPSWFKG